MWVWWEINLLDCLLCKKNEFFWWCIKSNDFNFSTNITNKLFIVIWNLVVDDAKINENVKSKIDAILKNSSIENDKHVQEAYIKCYSTQ